jgi:hypothetical protein
MNRYVIKKYVIAKSLAEALKKERDIQPEDAWKDEKQPDPVETTQIGFELQGRDSYISHSPYMKRKKKR